MKKILTLLVVFTVVFSEASANEIVDPKSPLGMVVVKSGSVFKVFYKGEKTVDVRVTILDKEGNTVYKETLFNVENFVRPYNFSSLADGNYTIQVEGETGKQQQMVSYSTIERSSRPMSLVRAASSPGKYILSIPNKDSEVLKVNIFDAENHLVYSASEKLNGDFAKLYNLSLIGEGFTFEITGEHGVSQNISYGRD